MTLEEQYNFLLKPFPVGTHFQKTNWNEWVEQARQISEDVCFKVLKEPEPYLTDVHNSAVLVLRQKNWDITTVWENGIEKFEYMPKNGKNWIIIEKPQPRYKSEILKEIIDKLLKNEIVYAKYVNEDNKTGLPLFTKNALKLVPCSYGKILTPPNYEEISIIEKRRFNRYWRDDKNKTWYSMGEVDQNCDIEIMNSNVYRDIFVDEYEAIMFVSLWKDKVSQMEILENMKKMEEERYQKEQKRLEGIFGEESTKINEKVKMSTFFDSFPVGM